MANREFTANVAVRHPDTYEVVVFLIGEEVPDWLTEVGDHVISEGTTQVVQSDDDASTGDDNTDETKDAADTPETPVDEEEEIPPYDQWSKTDLRAEVDGRELDVPSKANIAELVEALQADDAANAETE